MRAIPLRIFWEFSKIRKIPSNSHIVLNQPVLLSCQITLHFFKGKLFEYSSDSGLYVLIYAAKLACSPEKVLTNSGIDILIHDIMRK